MARKPRIHYQGAFYHVIVRGNNKAYIFETEEDKREYRIKMTKYIKKYNAKLYAYVLMDNHVHMLIQVEDNPLSKIMQLIQQTYTSYYNRKHQKTGHVFEQRYKAVHCDKDAYLLSLIRYIHQNPNRAGIGDINYKWSSHLEFVKGEKIHCEVDEIFKLFSESKGKAMSLYNQFVMNSDDIKEMKENEFEPDGMIKESIAIDVEKQTIEEVLEKYERVEGITLEQLKQRYKNKATNDLKSKFIQEVVKTTDMNQKQLAEYLETSEMSISRHKNNV